MKYTEVREVEYPSQYDPDNNAVDGFVTEAVNRASTFGEAVTQLVLKSTNRQYGNPNVLMTTRRHWSGYSEYTVTNQWSEIILTVPEWNWEHEWPSLGDFLRAMADANPDADR
jgi:hypothetical protein